MHRNTSKKVSTPKVSQRGENKSVVTQVDKGAEEFLVKLKTNQYIGFYLSAEIEEAKNKDELLAEKEQEAYKKFVIDEGKNLNDKLKQAKNSIKDEETRKDKIEAIIKNNFGITLQEAPQLYQIYYNIIDRCDPQGVADLELIRKQEIFVGTRALAQADKMISENGKNRVELIRYKPKKDADQHEAKIRQTLPARENEFRSIYKEACKYAGVWVTNDLLPVLKGTHLQNLYNNTDKKKSNFNKDNLARVQDLEKEIARHLLNIIWRRFLINFAMEIANEKGDKTAVAQLTQVLRNEPALILSEDICKQEQDMSTSINTPRKGGSFIDNRRMTVFAQVNSPQAKQPTMPSRHMVGIGKQEEREYLSNEEEYLLGKDESEQPGCCPQCSIM